MTPAHVLIDGRSLERPDRTDYWLAIRDGKVVAAGWGSDWLALQPPPRISNLQRAVVTTGFADLHSHGGAGHSYDTADPGGIRESLRFHRAHGTTLTALSLVTAPLEQTVARLRKLRDVVQAEGGVAGVHLEGPFLSAARRGAHDPAALIAPDPRAVDRLLEAGEGVIAQITIAPELPGAMEAIARFSAAGVTVAVGHTDADYRTARKAFDAGASLLTHAFNAMPGLHHRSPGPVAAAIDGGAVLEVIADGRHVHPSMISLLFAAAPGRVALVTDAMQATGAGDGAYRLGSVDVGVERGVATLAGSDTLAGSTLTQDGALRIALEAGIPFREALSALTATPRTVLTGTPGWVTVGVRSEDLVIVDREGQLLPSPSEDGAGQ